jgi:hypothetical protein
MMNDPRNPSSPDELGYLAAAISDIRQQLADLRAPRGTQLAQTVKNLTALVNNIQAQLDNYIATGTYNKAQIDAMLSNPPGAMTVNGLLTANTGLMSTDVYSRLLTVGPRKAVWVDSNGRLGVTT